MPDLSDIAEWANRLGETHRLLVLEREFDKCTEHYVLLVRDPDAKPSDMVRAIFRWLDDDQLTFGSQEALEMLRRIPSLL